MNRQEYINYQARFEAFMKTEGLNCLTAEDDSEPEFSWKYCDCCNGPPGDRYTAVGYQPKTNTVGGPYQVCQDCLYYAAYGQLDDMTMLKIEEG